MKTKCLIAVLATISMGGTSALPGIAAGSKAPVDPPQRWVGGSAESRLVEDAANARATTLAAPNLNLRRTLRLEARRASGEDLSVFSTAHPVRPVSVASADLDGDGVADLVAGYGLSGGGRLVVHPGNVDARFPRSRGALERKARGTFVDAPFLPEVTVFDTPVVPEFLAAGDFDGDGRADVVLADRNDAALWLFSGEGDGRLNEPKRLSLPSPVTAMTVGELDRADGLVDLAVAVADHDQRAQILVFSARHGALSAATEAIPLPAAASALATGAFEAESSHSLAAAVGRRLVIVHGRDAQPDGSPHKADKDRVEIVALDHPVVDVVAGRFLSAARSPHTLAVLTDDGAVRLFDGRNEIRYDAAPELAPRAGSRLVRAFFGSGREEDLVVVDPARRTASLRVGSAERLAFREPPLAVLPLQLNDDALTDLVVLSASEPVPSVLLSGPEVIFTVDSEIDADDDVMCDGACKSEGAGGRCTLRAAVREANCTADADTIVFNLTDPKISLYQSIYVTNYPVTIDGSTGDARVVLDGTKAGGDGLVLVSNGCVVRSLVINGFPCGALRMLGGASHRVEDCYIGPGSDGAGTPVRNGWGIEINHSSSNVIGGTTAHARNVLSNNKLFGVGIFTPDEPARSNSISGNYIGTDAAGAADVPNGGEDACTNSAIAFSAGVQVGDITVMAISNNTIGGTVSAVGQPPGNVISGNNGPGVNLSQPQNNVIGNIIGPTASGMDAQGKQPTGVLAKARGLGNHIGGTEVSQRNLISGNNGPGVRVLIGATDNVITGNLIGTDITGLAGMKNAGAGVRIEANRTYVGAYLPPSSSPGVPPGNVISGNGDHGISIVGGSATVKGNLIGTKAGGTAALANVGAGVLLTGVSGSTIGGTSELERNVISGNTLDGVKLDGAPANTVQGNFIGVSITGAIAIPNVGNGVSVGGASNAAFNIIGGTTSVPGTGAGNVISGNRQNGVLLSGALASQTRVGGNLIGTNSQGSAMISNWANGVAVVGAPSNTVGSSNFTSGNVISGNNRSTNTDGVEISGAGATGNFIQGNTIGTDVGGTLYLPNRGNGVLIQNGASNNWINSNTIANSIGAGVRIPTSDVMGTWIRYNTFRENIGLGIDLGPLGVTANDDKDPDTGANNLQNAPIVDHVAVADDAFTGTATIFGTLNSTPNSSFVIDVFDNASSYSGDAEGEIYLGTVSCGTDPLGNCSWSLTTSAELHTFLTAIATCSTTPAGACRDTSEFSVAPFIPLPRLLPRLK